MTDKELVKLLIDNTNDFKTQKLLASLGYYPEYFMYSDSQDVRAEVAKRGYGLDILVNDSAACVRSAVARRGRDIVENLNLKNVFLVGEKVFVLTDMKA